MSTITCFWLGQVFISQVLNITITAQAHIQFMAILDYLLFDLRVCPEQNMIVNLLNIIVCKKLPDIF